MAYTTWLLADLVDYLGEERGQRDRFSDRIVELLTVDPEQGGESDAGQKATWVPTASTSWHGDRPSCQLLLLPILSFQPMS